MTDQSFNLVDRPWIPVEFVNGTDGVVSLREVFARSREISQIDGEVATQVFAILGLLSAILRRTFDGPRGQDAFDRDDPRRKLFEPTTFGDWKKWYESPDVALSEVNAYLDEFHSRFDVRDPAVPFYQVADLRTSKDEYSRLEVLLADVPNGLPLFTTRIREGNQRISWAEAARWLIHAQAFDPAGIRSGAVGDPRVSKGKGYSIGPGWGAQIGGLVVERPNLWQTLMINLVPVGSGDLAFDVDADLPPWEREQLTEKEEVIGGRQPRGPVDLATWQSRRIRLVGDDDGVVGVVLCQGDQIKPQNRVSFEPRTSWRYSDPQSKKEKTIVYMPREHDPARAMWRGLESLIPGASPREDRVKTAVVSRYRAPGVSEWIGELLKEEVLSPADPVKYRASGVQLGTQQSVIDELIDDSISLPAPLFTPSAISLRNMVVSAARLADDLARHFGYFAANLAKAAGADLTDGEESKAREQLYSAVGMAYQHWILSVSPETISDDEREWSSLLYEISENEKKLLIAAVPRTAYVGRQSSRGEVSVAKAESYYRAACRKLGIGPYKSAERKDNDSDE